MLCLLQKVTFCHLNNFHVSPIHVAFSDCQSTSRPNLTSSSQLVWQDWTACVHLNLQDVSDWDWHLHTQPFTPIQRNRWTDLTASFAFLMIATPFVSSPKISGNSTPRAVNHKLWNSDQTSPWRMHCFSRTTESSRIGLCPQHPSRQRGLCHDGTCSCLHSLFFLMNSLLLTSLSFC